MKIAAVKVKPNCALIRQAEVGTEPGSNEADDADLVIQIAEDNCSRAEAGARTEQSSLSGSFIDPRPRSGS
jgi:hypothetical protein